MLLSYNIFTHFANLNNVIIVGREAPIRTCDLLRGGVLIKLHLVHICVSYCPQLYMYTVLIYILDAYDNCIIVLDIIHICIKKRFNVDVKHFFRKT